MRVIPRTGLGRRGLLGGAAAVAGGRLGFAEAPFRAPVFPLRIAGDGRRLEDSAGRPFLIHGDTAWSLIAQLTPSEAALYLQDRHDRGFNTLLVNLIEHRFATKAPANIRGDPPFLRPNDFAAPNEAYFAHADTILSRARSLGFLVLLTPAYVGTSGGPEGWYRPMQEAGVDALRRYGAYVARRFRHLDNILWVHAGDYNPPDKRLVRVIADEIRRAQPLALHTAHCQPETAPADYFHGEPWLQVNNVYTYRPVLDMASRQYARAGRMPFFLLESAYENEHSSTEERLRAQAYQAVLCGGCGQVFGNSPIWHYGASSEYPRPMRWQTALSSRGAEGMAQLRQVMEAAPWFMLDPDTSNRFLVAPGGQGHERTVAAVARDGSCAIAYVVAERDVTVDLGPLRGDAVVVRWRDPTSGAVLNAPRIEPGRTRRWRFTKPGANANGYSDWILEVRAHAA